mmetsp:Transcript_81654/g.210235  ORF Transcript_81654/g.210235 Transcript_81654/m.210235 type:complete len:114 (+) Transcript_81654:53-394(+)
MVSTGSSACKGLRLALLLLLGSLAAAAASATCAAADGTCSTAELPKDHAMLQVGKAQPAKGEPIVPTAEHHPEHLNPYVDTVDMEHKELGCFPRAAGDPVDMPMNFRDVGCAI